MDPREAIGVVTAEVIKYSLESGRVKVGDHVAVLNLNFVLKADTDTQAEALAEELLQKLREEHPGDETTQVQAVASLHSVEVMDASSAAAPAAPSSSSTSSSSDDDATADMARVLNAVSGPLDRMLSGVSAPTIEEFFDHLRSHVLGS